MNLAAIVLDEPSLDCAAVYTRNALCGAPVTVGRRRMREGAPVQAIVINNKVSNVYPGGTDGEADAETVCAAVADAIARVLSHRGDKHARTTRSLAFGRETYASAFERPHTASLGGAALVSRRRSWTCAATRGLSLSLSLSTMYCSPRQTQALGFSFFLLS